MNNTLLISSLILIAEDLVSVIKSESGTTYYSSTLKRVIDISQVQEIIDEAKEKIKNE